MTSVAEVLRSKPSGAVYTVGPSAPVIDVLRLMAEKNVGALLVVDDEAIVGIVSERDHARKVALQGRSPDDTPVRDIMTSPVMFVHPGHSSEQCMALMTENRLRHLPVMDQGTLVGLISIGDLVKNIISEQRFIIDQLEHYISGARE